MSINWNNLRAWNGSQESSFEELCCQLAAAESVPAQSRFFRKGTPDAGVECFWRLPNGEEWAWQAKFFRNSPGPSQWAQVHESVTTALRKHPRLTKYVVCMPIDLPDERRPKQKSALQKWQDHVVKWQQLAAKKGMAVSFDYWGQSQIAARLSHERHRGRHWFWFTEEHLSNAWFVNRMNESLSNARDRYSPELNVDLPLHSAFDALGRTPLFLQGLSQLYSNASIALKRLRPPAEPKLLAEKYEQIAAIAPGLLGRFEPWLPHRTESIEWTVTRPLPWEDIASLAQQLCQLADDCTSDLFDLKDARKKDPQDKGPTKTDDLDWQLHHLREFQSAIRAIAAYSRHTDSTLTNHPFLLLVGDAGQGKTHLLCEVAKEETNQCRPRLLFHGEQFHDDEPWSQMIRLLGLDCSREEFLGALEAAAQANNCRVLIFIDALNEGAGNRLWMKFLPGMLTALAQSQWLGLCVSVRSSYEKYVIPTTLDQTKLSRIEHRGFEELADAAANKFFAAFGISPSTPLLLPEFNNPLFLKLFCQSIRNAGLNRVPPGLRGITATFNFFIESIDKKLARPEHLDYDDRESAAVKAVQGLADAMAHGKTDRLPLDQAKSLVNAVLPRDGHLRSLFYHLQSEGVLTITPEPVTGVNGWMECVRFTYQRFSDHLITQRLLARHLDKVNPTKSFSKARTLGRLLKDEQACWINSGILQAMAVQVPELTKKELPDLVPHLADFYPMRDAFVKAIVWRDASSFTPATNRYINKHIVTDSDTGEQFWDTLILLATTPAHPYNADRLHKVLNHLDLPDRDAWWSIFLHNQWEQDGAAHRLVEWASQDDDKSAFSDEVIRLAALTLAWFFTSSNRFLRDRATKAMVRLCQSRLSVLGDVMAQFVHVNDPYVSERLYAAAYGCAMRTCDMPALQNLAQSVYRCVFESGEPPPQILLRDYARGVIEVAISRGVTLAIDAAKVRPPYRSEWPSFTIPDLEQLKPLKEWKDRAELPRAHLYHSVMGDEDFSRYVIGELHEWSSQPLNGPHVPTQKELHDTFVASLTPAQKAAWTQYRNVLENVGLYRRLEPEDRSRYFDGEFTDADLERAIKDAERRCLKSLGTSRKRRRLFRDATAYAAEPHSFYREDGFDSQMARRWMMQRILDLGWTLQRFGNFDTNVNRYSAHGREANKPERIGKKYQWIAYHELLARLADNFKMRKDHWASRDAEYTGPWCCGHGREIDPSNLLRSTQRDEWHSYTNNWWFPTAFSDWHEPADEVAWLKGSTALPPAEGLIEVTNPDDGSLWLTLNAYYDWRQPTPPGEDRNDFRCRELWYMLKGYLVRKTDAAKLFTWAKKQNWMGRWMPESHDTYSLFLGEFFWAPAFKEQDCEYCGRPGWTRGDGDKIPVEVLVANDDYGCEARGFDCSLEDTIFITLPCRLLVDELQLGWRGVEGNWYTKNGDLAACDPSVRNKGPRALLFRRDLLLEFLDTNGLTIFWTLLGEKRAIGGSISRQDYKGHLEINGAFVLKNGRLLQHTSSQFQSPARRDE